MMLTLKYVFVFLRLRSLSGYLCMRGRGLQPFHAPLSGQRSLRPAKDDLNHARCVLYEPSHTALP